MGRLGFAVIFGVVCAMAAPARADGPDYEATVGYINSLLNTKLTEQKRCVFAAKAPGAEHEGVFHAASLDIVPSVIKPTEIHFECRKGEQCIAGKSHTSSVLNVTVHSDANDVAIAISRLIELCGTHAH
ncbi:MAG: hypothetical protein K2P94_13725 [Rhodospirillaceae bacterium]|nr:hypothetical protein [Rhodospirillaceae bacterium]